MKKLLISLLAGVLLLPLAAQKIQLTRNGKALYRIVFTPLELEAAKELQDHIKQISGATLPLMKENKNFKGHAIWLGDTARARKAGIDSSKLQAEQWVIKTVGKDLIIAGGRRHAVQRGVYDFLENQLGCRWYAYDTTVIPKNKNIVINKLDIKKRPSFDSREIYDNFVGGSWVLPPKVSAAMRTFRKRIGSSGDFGYAKFWPRSTTRYRNAHNFYYFLDPKKYYKDHPEYFSMNKEGKRIHGKIGPSMQGANFCLTNPKVRDIVTAKMLETIALDRKKLPKHRWPDLYSLSPNDADRFLCLCPECAALEKKERKMGLLLDFINDVARRVYKKYPDVLIKTFSYSAYVEPPVTLVPEKNVIIEWCNLFGFNDCYRPITHKINAGQKAQFDRWVKTGANLSIWAYWNMGGSFFNPARVETMIDAIGPDLRYYHKNGVTMIFAENGQALGDNKQNFYVLQVYVGLKLMMDITLDEKKLIADFMKAYYGPAEKPMTSFLNRLRKAVAAVPARMASVNPGRSYCTEEFMRANWKDLEEAYKLTKPGSLYRKHVEDEMVSPMYIILRNVDWKIGNREKMLAHYKSIRERYLGEYGRLQYKPVQKRRAAIQNKLRADLLSFTKLNLPIPEQFNNRGQVKIFGWPQLKWSSGVGFPDQFVDDPDSVPGKAMITRAPRKSRGERDNHNIQQKRRGMYSSTVGVYDYNTKSSIVTELRKKIHKDEKYHWYKVGKCDIKQGSFIWAFFWGCQCPLAPVWQHDDGIEGINEWEIWVSFKFTGPAYVEGSTKPNQIYWDQVLLVKDK